MLSSVLSRGNCPRQAFKLGSGAVAIQRLRWVHHQQSQAYAWAERELRPHEHLKGDKRCIVIYTRRCGHIQWFQRHRQVERKGDLRYIDSV